MPIDLKWIRNNPDLVRTWQEQRGLSTENVDRFIHLDHRSRALLKHLENQRSELKKLKKSHRPSVTNEIDSDSKKKKKKSREEILQERELIDESIRQAEKEWKAASKENLQALWCIASPVDQQVSNSSIIKKGQEFVTTADSKSCTSVGIHRHIRKKFPEFDFTKGPGLDLAQAILSMARRRFAMYPICKLPTTVSVSKNNTTSHDESSVESDHALAMCGCIEAANCDNFYNQPSTIPGWLGMITHRFPPKSIFGAKQLPRFASIWGRNTTTADSTDTFEIIAMTAGTVWDSRSVQSRLLEELELFYRDLLSLQSLDGDNRESTTNVDEVAAAATTTTRVALPANQLEMHELSRIILRTNPAAAGDGDGGRPLGYVSNFGDSVSRANQIQFGLQKKGKEYVHFVRAVVLTPSIIATVMEANISDDVVKIPNTLVSLLPWTASNDDDDEITNRSILPLKSLLKQDRSSFFGQVKDSQPPSQKVPASTAKFSALELRETEAQHPPSCRERMNYEALSCPFDFLFPQ